MSYMKSIHKNKAYAAASPQKQAQHEGGIDVLIVSTEPGDPEPMYHKLKKEQVSSAAGREYIKFLREIKMPGEDKGWAMTFDGVDHRWHQIDNFGTVCCPWPCALMSSHPLRMC